MAALRAKSRAAPPAAFVVPMKALGADSVPAGGSRHWISEIKFDGYRAVAVLNQGRVELWSRNHKPLAYPELIPALEALPCTNAVLDGEIVALDAHGRSDFQSLQGRDLGERPPIVYYLFDIVHLDGVSLAERPLEERRSALEDLMRKAKRPVLLSPIFDEDPELVLKEAKAKGLEGIILKRRGSRYESDRRSGTWLKLKNLNEQEFVIGGFTPPKNSRPHFGAILVGYYEGRRLVYAGKVGTGFDRQLLTMLHREFLKLQVASCPFSNLPLDTRSRFGQGMTRAVMRTVTWVKPRLVAQIRFAEWTQEGLLRQPVFLGLRRDKPAAQVRREAQAV